MGRSVIMRKVNASLEGLEIRNSMREAARRMAHQIKRIYQARRLKLLNELDSACEWLTDNGIGWNDEKYYGVTIVSTHCGVTLAYDPSKKLSYATAPRLDRDGYPEQMDLLTSPLQVEPSSPAGAEPRHSESQFQGH